MEVIKFMITVEQSSMSADEFSPDFSFFFFENEKKGEKCFENKNRRDLLGENWSKPGNFLDMHFEKFK